MPQKTVIIRFAKLGIMRYISHLDLLRLFQRASRRAGLPLAISAGYNPHPKIKIEPAIKLGLESRDLRAVIVLTEEIPLEIIHDRLFHELPKGIDIEKIEYIL